MSHDLLVQRAQCMGSFMFCHPAILQFLIGAISLLIECKELQLAQNAPINQVFQLSAKFVFTATSSVGYVAS